jgi:hypothetical protein
MRPLPETLFHGTSTKYLDQIMTQGLRPCHMTGRVLMTCLTDELVTARHHAFHMADWEQADEVIFRIPTARLDPGLFTLEDKFVNPGPSAGRGVAVKRTMLDSWQDVPWTWLAMLRIAGAVGYTGVIPVGRDDLMT